MDQRLFRARKAHADRRVLQPRGLTALVVCSYLLFVGFQFNESMDEVAAEKGERVARLAHSLESQILRTEVAVRAVARVAEMTTTADAARLMATIADEERLGRMAALNRAGIIEAESIENAPHLGMDASDRDYFRAFGDRPPRRELVFIGDALIARRDGAPLIPLSVGVYDDAGTLMSVVVGALDRPVMTTLLRQTPDRLREGEFLVLRKDGGAALLQVDNERIVFAAEPAWDDSAVAVAGAQVAVGTLPLTLTLSASSWTQYALAAQMAAPGAGVGLVLMLMALLVVRSRDEGQKRRWDAETRERERISSLLGLSGNRFWEIDASGICVAAHGAWSDGRAVDPKRYVGDFYLRVITRVNGEGSRQRIAAALAEQRPFSRMPVTVITPDGAEGHAALSGAPLLNEDGAFAGWRLVAVDVTDQVRTAELKTALTTKTRLIAAISHDMRQPIQAIMLFLGLARDAAVAPKAQEMVERSIEIAGSLLRQIVTLSDLGRVEGDMIRPHQIVTSIRPLLDRAASEQGAIAAAHNKTVRSVIPETDVLTDPVLLERVIDNILNNAVKFARSRVLIGARRRGQHLLIEVIDDGPGIAPEHHDMIFHAWERRDVLPRTGADGTGIGLAVSRQIAEALGITIRLHSRPGGGARFTLELPAEPVLGDARRDRAERPPGSVIVAVDDDPAIRAALTTALTTDSQTVVAYPTGEAALAADLDGLRPDAFLIDLNLGEGIDGGALIRQLITRPGGDAQSYIVLSGEPPDIVGRLLGDLPVRRVLRKPIRLEELTRAIEAATQRAA